MSNHSCAHWMMMKTKGEGREEKGKEKAKKGREKKKEKVESWSDPVS